MAQQYVKIFPGIPIYICRYHALRSLSRGFGKYTVSKTIRQEWLSIAEKMVFCKTQSEYDDLYNKLRDIAPKETFEYFNCNLHNIQKEWSAFHMTCGNLGNYTNNRLESINKHIKTVAKNRSSLLEFLETFFTWIQSNNHENDFQTANALLKLATCIVIMSDISDDEKQSVHIIFNARTVCTSQNGNEKCKVRPLNKTQ